MPKTMPALHARIGAPGCLFSFSRSSDIKFQFIRMNYGRSPKVHTYEPEAHALNREHSGYQPNGIANAGSHPVHTYEPGATTGSNHGRSQFIRMNFTGSRPVHTYELNNRVLITCEAIGQLDRKAHLKLPSVHTYEPGATTGSNHGRSQFIRMNFTGSRPVHTYELNNRVLITCEDIGQLDRKAHLKLPSVHTYEPGATTGSNHGRSQFIRMNFTGSRPVHTYELINSAFNTGEDIGQLDRKANLGLLSVHTYEPSALAYSSHVRHQFIRMNFKDSKLVHTYEPDGDAKPPRSTTACQYEPRNSGVRCFWRIEFGDLPMR